MTQPGHLHWQLLSRTSKSLWWSPSTEIVAIDRGVYDPARTSPLAIAQQNEQEFVVESINGNRGNAQWRSMIEFKVRWAEFGESCDS